MTVVPPGFLVTVQVPEEGNPLNATLPVPTLQVGCVTKPVTGAEGARGGAGITTSSDKVAETHPEALVTE